MKTASWHLLNLINEILDMSKIESGKATLNIQPFRMAEQIAQVDSVIRQQAVLRDQQFTVQVHDLLHENVEGDATRLRQVLLNILSNAVKYTGHGGSISLNVEEILRSGHYARYKFTVTDNGIGMSEAFQKHIYESFSRAENSVTNKVQGTGLGMAITKKLVDQMHGSLDVESTPGKGSTFTVRLSLPLAETAYDTPEEEPPADLHGLHLLMAEDNELNREIAVTLLEERGAAITTAENGREAVELFQNAPQGTFDAVLMDVMMPEMNGLEATRAIRAFEHCPPESGIPIIAMTANVFADDVKACLEAGMNSHVGKPLDMQVLAAEICRQMRRHTALLESADFTKLGN